VQTDHACVDEDPELARVAGAILDRSPVDCDTLESSAGDEQRALIPELRARRNCGAARETASAAAGRLDTRWRSWIQARRSGRLLGISEDHRAHRSRNVRRCLSRLGQPAGPRSGAQAASSRQSAVRHRRFENHRGRSPAERPAPLSRIQIGKVDDETTCRSGALGFPRARRAAD